MTFITAAEARQKSNEQIKPRTAEAKEYVEKEIFPIFDAAVKDAIPESHIEITDRKVILSANNEYELAAIINAIRQRRYRCYVRFKGQDDTVSMCHAEEVILQSLQHAKVVSLTLIW